VTDEMPPGGENPTPSGEQNPAPAPDAFGQPGDQPGYGQPGPGVPPAPGYGQPGPYGQPGCGQPSAGAPQYPPPAGPYGQPGYGQPSAGAPQYPPPAGPYGQPGLPPYPPGYGGWQAAPAPGGVPLRPLSLGDIFNGTVNLARRNPAATFGLTAIIMTVYAVALALLHRFFGSPAAAPAAGPGSRVTAHLLGAAVKLPPGALVATYALALVTNAVVTGLLSVVIGRGVLGYKVSLAQAWRAGRAGVVVGTSLLLLLVEFVPPGIIALLVIGLAVAHVAPAAILLGVLGGIGTIVYEVLVVIRLSLTMPALVLERISPVAAIRRSWQLSRGSFWRLLGILLLTYIVVVVVAFVLSIPFELVETAIAGSAGTSGPALVVAAIGTIVAATVTRPVSAGVSVLLYADMRMRREGLDLLLRNAVQDQTLTVDEFATVRQRSTANPASPGAW
jgi:Membrane domain of glycerophosphoryl diester phosphodiesterase